MVLLLGTVLGVVLGTVAQARLCSPEFLERRNEIPAEGVLRLSAQSTVSVDLSRVLKDARTAFQKNLMEQAQRLGTVMVLSHDGNSFEAIPRFVNGLKIKDSPDYSHFGLEKDIELKLSHFVTGLQLTEQKPLLVIVRDFIPYIEKGDPISALVKFLHELRTRAQVSGQGDLAWAKAVRVIVCAETSAQSWAFKNVGMTGEIDLTLQP